MTTYSSLNSFVRRTGDLEAGQGGLPPAFEVEQHFLKVNLGTQTSPIGGRPGDILKLVYIKKESMVGYVGNMKFQREGFVEHGVMNKLKKTVTGEGLSLTKASCSDGRATLFLADNDKAVTVMYLQEGDTIFVEGCKVLAIAPTVTHNVRMMKTVSGFASVGMFSVKLKGPGFMAILTKGDPITLPVTPGNPVFTDPQATVAWSGNLVQDFKTNIQLKALVGRSSGQSFQLKFQCKSESTGFVVIQPSEKSGEDAKESSGGLINGTVSAMQNLAGLAQLQPG